MSKESNKQECENAKNSSAIILKYQKEIERLKRFLVQLDKEIEEDGKRSSVQIAELEAALADKDSIIDELNMSLSKQGPNPQTEDEYVFFLEDENDKLERIVAGQEKNILELEEKSNNLQAALALLQANMQEELSMGLIEAKKHLSALEAQLIEANATISELKIQNGKDQSDSQLAGKLIKDLDARNFLIDQLNDEINNLKARIDEMVRGEAGQGREGLVDKAYLRSLLVNLAHPPPKVDRMEIWRLLSRTLGMNKDELRRIGLRLVDVEAKSDDSTGIKQGLSDVWISFLLNETLRDQNSKERGTQM